jgi:hypothetical protein
MKPTRRHVEIVGLLLVGSSQIASSLSNLGASVLVARVAGLGQLGESSIAMGGYLAGLGVQRAILADPLIAGGRRQDNQLALVASAVMGLVFAIPLGLLGLAFDSKMILLVALCLPLLLPQDLARYVGFRSPRPRLPVALDLVWLVTIVALAVPVLRLQSAFWAMAAWCLGGVMSGAVGLLVFRVGRTSVPAAVVAVRELGRGLAGHLLAESVIVQSVVVLGIPLAAASIGLTTAGVARAATLLLAPVALVATSIGTYGFAAVARSKQPHVVQVAATYSILAGAAAALAGAVIVAGAIPFSRWLLGADSEVTPAYVLPFAVAVAASGFATGAVSLMKRLRAGARLLAVRAAAVAPAATILALGVFLDNEWLVFYSAAAAAGIHTALAWNETRRMARR